MRQRFVDWFVGILEDDPIPYGIDEIIFVVDNRYPRVNLSIRAMENDKDGLFYPIESEAFLDSEFINWNIDDKVMYQKVKSMIEYLLNRCDEIRSLRIKIQFIGKNTRFLEQIR